MLFTLEGIELIHKLILSKMKNEFQFTVSRNGKLSLCEDIPSFTDRKNRSNLILKTKLLEPFVYFYEKRELPCRDAVKNYNYSNYNSENFKKHLKDSGIDVERLEKGIAFNDLANRISYISEQYDYVTFTSIFLDKMISRGIAVPMLQESSDFVFRSYRHGEDAIFGDAENQMVTVALHEICKSANRKKLTKIETEKLVSLFIKFGIKGKWLDELQDDNQNIETNKIIVTNRHDTFGMRADIKSSDQALDEDNVSSSFGKHSWFVPYLIKKGYITAVSGGYEFKGDFSTDLQKGADAHPDIVVFSETFAEIIKYFDENKSKEIPIDDTLTDTTTIEWVLTKLASCIYPKDQIDALASEIYLFKHHWAEFVEIDFKKYCELQKNKEFHQKYNKALYAINSGQKKYTAYKNFEPREIIDKLGKVFPPIYNAELQRIVDLRLNESRQDNSENLIDNLGHWLIGINFAIRILKFCDLLYNDKNISQHFMNNRCIYKSYIQEFLAQGDIDSKEQIKDCINSQKFSLRKQNFINLLSDMVYYEYRVKKLNRPLKSIQALLKEEDNLFNDNILLEDIGNNILQIIRFLLDRTTNLLNTAAIELEYFEKPTNKKYYQTAINVVAHDNFYDLIKTELLDFEENIISKSKDKDFPYVYISQKSILANGFTILFYGDQTFTNALNLLRKLKKYLIGVKQLIVFNNLPATYSFRIVRQNTEPRLVVHNNTVIELMEKIYKEISLNNYYMLEVGSLNLLKEIGLKKNNIEKQVEMEDNTKITVGEYSIRHIDKNNIKVGIITALSEEYEAIQKLLLHIRRVSISARGAGHNYVFGYLPIKNNSFIPVAISCINGMGNNAAAIQAQNLLNDLYKVNYIIMTGIAGAAPNIKDTTRHVRLGDVVISDKRGIVQYDYVKISDKIEQRGININSGAKLLEASIELERALKDTIKEKIINEIFESRPDDDVLHDKDGKVVEHPYDNSRINNEPKLFLGGIGAANILLKDPVIRDRIRDELNILAFEMEGSGIADASWNSEAQYIVVRGICDYGDSFKNDKWHKYAACVAAVYTKWLIYFLNI